MTTRCTNIYTKILQYTLILISTVLFTVSTSVSFGQCAVPNVGCSNTNLANYGSNSNTNAAAIEYDNFVSSYHSTVARTGDGSLQLWGERMANDGVTNLF